MMAVVVRLFSAVLYVSISVFWGATAQGDVPVVCGGLIKSPFQVDFTRIKVNLYSLDGNIKYSTDCAPNNGYFMLPLYDQGEYIVRAVPPEGWMITPNEVPLVVKGSTDPCSSGKDIIFQLVGFTLTGQVTSGDDALGPEGVEVSLIPSGSEDEDSPIGIRYVYTAREGRFQIDGVSPGSYQLKASHPLWKVSKNAVEVSVENAPVAAPSGLKVLGYDAKGVVRSGGEPVEGVFLFLFSPEQDKQIECSLNVPTSLPSPKKGTVPLCTVTSDKTGQFILYPLPPGTYSVVPIYRQTELQFEVHPTELQFTVSNDSVILSDHFEVQGFSVTGKVLLTPKGSPVPNAQVFLGENHVAATDEQGRYLFLNVTTGTYTLKIEADDMQFEAHEVHISPTSPTMTPVSPDKYIVCGDVAQTISTAVSEKFPAREVQVLASGSDTHVIGTTFTKENGDFCIYLPLGEFRIKVVVPLEEVERGLMILPEEQLVAMLDTPVTGRITFSQFLANLSGFVECIENCPEKLDISLVRTHKGSQELSAQVKNNGKTASFSFTGVLPGTIKVILKDSKWCWKTSEISSVIVKGSQNPVKFSHTGYSMTYEVSHDTLIKYSRSNDSTEEAVLTGKGSLCLAKPGVYQIKTESCHKFEKKVYVFSTSSPAHLQLTSTGHYIHIPVYTESEDPSLALIITRGGGEVVLQPEKVEQVEQGKLVYSFQTLVQPSQELNIRPQSSVLMFSPSSVVWKVGQECPETVTALHGSPGMLVEGLLQPPVANVTVVVDLGEDGQVITYTDSSGKYRAGPVRGDSHISVSVALDGYMFEPLGDSRSFHSIQLSGVVVQVVNVQGTPLPGVLVSISGEKFRQNSFTDEKGNLAFSELAPGQYFIKPFLREFDFTPSSSTVDMKPGESQTTVFNGRRVAFSCSGVISTLNRQTLEAVPVQGRQLGSEEQCSYSEAAITDAQGVYRLHGLMPGCHYNVSVNGNSTSIALPPFKIITVEEADKERVDFFLMSHTSSVYISGWVDADSKLLGTLKAAIFSNGRSEEAPLYSVTVDAVGFFDFPLLPSLSKGDYLIRLESGLSVHSYKYSSVERVVSGNRDSHTILQFSAEELVLEKESQSRGSVVALVLVIVTAFACMNFDKLLAWIRSYANTRPSPIEGTDKQKKTQRTSKK